jgi:ribose/xylose/arabinose/galactoside ABC-type transport system permease subunit
MPLSEKSNATVPHTGSYRRIAGPYMLAIAIVAIGAILAVLNPRFLAPANLINVIRQISINGILAIGVTYVLLTGGVDLSLGSVAALAGIFAAGVAHPGAMPLVAAVFAGVIAGSGCGLVNGIVVTRGRVPSFIATLGMMTAARGFALVVSDGRPVTDLSAAFAQIAGGDWLGIPNPVLILGAVAAVSHVFLRHIWAGRHIYAVGGNENAARASGIDVDRVKVFAYVVCGAAAGLGGVVLASRITAGQPNAAIGYELDAIAAAVIGGTSLSGGVGTVPGTLLGALLIGEINNGLDLLNVSSYYQQITKGLIIVGAVCAQQRARK